MSTNRTDIETHWPEIRRVCRGVYSTSLHFSIASVNPGGTPHLSPIGSLRLLKDCRATYFEIFTQQMPANLEAGSRVCVLGVNSSKLLWLGALWKGRFASPPGVRLMGTAGERRTATEEERAWWRRQVKPFRRMKGFEGMWGDRNLAQVRELHFDAFKPIQLGEIASGFWSPSPAQTPQ